MRIVQVIGRLSIGGAEAQVVRMARELADRRHDVMVLALRAGGPLERDLREADVQTEVAGLAGLDPLHPLDTLRGLASVTRSLRRFRPDVVHAHLVGSYQVAIPIARLLRVPVRVSARRALGEHKLVSRQGRALARLATRWSTDIVANASAVAEVAIAEEGLDRSRVHVIANGVDIPDEVRADVAAMPPVGYVVANLRGEKNHVLLLRALAIMAHPPEVHLVGSGPEEDAIRREIAALGLERTVVLEGAIRDGAGCFDRAQFGVLPSDWEGLPNAVLECMARGVPMVATAVAGVPDLITDGVDGVLVPPGDPKALAVALDRICADPARRVELGRAARERMEDYSWDRMVDRHVDLYRSALEAAGRRRPRALMSDSPVPSLRILLVVPRLVVGGSEMRMVRLAGALQAAGHSVQVVALTSGGPLGERLEELGVPFTTLAYDGPSLRRPWRLARQLRPLWRLMRRWQPDVVEGFLSYAYLPAMILGAAARVPVRISTRVVTFRSVDLGRPYQALLHRLSTRLASIVLANSEDGARDAREVEGVPADKVRVLENAVELPSELADVAATPAVGAIVARLHPVKAHRDLIEALALIPDPPRIRIVGDGSERESLERLVDERGLGEVVSFEGEVSGVEVLSQVQFSCLTSTSEGMSNAVLEAMAAGLPVVATAVGGSPELVSDGVNGLLVPPGSPAELASAIQRIAGDPELRVCMGAAGRARAEAMGWPQSVRRHEELFAEVLRRSRRGRARLGDRRPV